MHSLFLHVNSKCVSLCALSSHVWLWRHAVPPERDREHNYCLTTPCSRQRGACQVRKWSQIYVSGHFLCIPKCDLLKGAHLLRVQHIPGGGWRRDGEEGEEGAGSSGVFPFAHVPWRGPGPGHATLLHSRAAAQQSAGGQSIHCGRQSHLQRLLEQPFRSAKELPCLLPSYEQLQRGEWLSSATSGAADLPALNPPAAYISIQSNAPAAVNGVNEYLYLLMPWLTV